MLSILFATLMSAPASMPTVIDFEQETLLGETLDPGVRVIEGRKDGCRIKMIRLRAHFRAEVLQSLNAL